MGRWEASNQLIHSGQSDTCESQLRVTICPVGPTIRTYGEDGVKSPARRAAIRFEVSFPKDFVDGGTG